MEQRFIFYLRTLSSTPYGYTVNIKKLSDFNTVHTCHIAIKDNSITRFKVTCFSSYDYIHLQYYHYGYGIFAEIDFLKDKYIKSIEIIWK